MLEKKAIRKACQSLTLSLPSGEKIPKLGQGTWKMGDTSVKAKEEIKALRKGIDLGLTLIDTAEMYGDGRSESLIGEAIKDVKRDALFLVSKVYPHHAGEEHIFDSCKASMKRLGVDYLDLYLLHWRGSIPLEETVQCMEQLVADGWIRYWGVSNFDTEDMKELWQIKDGQRCAVNQVLYHLGSRGIEYDLLPWMKAHHIPVMAYCPIAQGGALRRSLIENQIVNEIAKKYDITPIQVLLGFVLSQPSMVAIPKASTVQHVKENAYMSTIKLTDEDLNILSETFPAPTSKTRLDIV